MAHHQSDPSPDAIQPAISHSQDNNPTAVTQAAPAQAQNNTTAATVLESAEVSVQQALLLPVQIQARPSLAEGPVDPIIEELTRRYNESLRISDAQQQIGSGTPDHSGFAAYCQNTINKLTMISELPFTSADAKAMLMATVAQIQALMSKAVASGDEMGKRSG